MTLVREIVKDAAIGVGVAETPEGLSVIHNPGCAAAIWRRDPLASFQSWIDGLRPEQLPKARVILRPEAVRDAVVELCEASGIPAGLERDRLVDDVAALAAIFYGFDAIKMVAAAFGRCGDKCLPQVPH
ncbi:DUF1826 domain-containing protein [Ruegeria arenilitoris]|uniref:DUF1826 domain-containing protein n=1 Tax=Ruegeria arenilitoris TaxID=1173585 RepID=UPI00147D91DC